MKATYLYPMKHKVSFTLVARKHIEILQRAGWDIVEGEVNNVYSATILPVTFVHPMFYPLVSGPKAYRRLLRHADKLVGFDVADTNRISSLAAYVASQFDLVFVPTRAIAKIYKDSGVIAPIEVLPHGIDEKWLRKNIRTLLTDSSLLCCIEEKRKQVRVEKRKRSRKND